MRRTTAPLILLEGPSGSGKTTLAKAIVERLDAHYIHFTAMKHLQQDALRQIYVDAMLPARLGDRAVVFDRCWWSNVIYLEVMKDLVQARLSPIDLAILTEYALHCDAVIVLCRPPLDDALRVVAERHCYKDPPPDEQRAAWVAYGDTQDTELPFVLYDWTQAGAKELLLVHLQARFRDASRRDQADTLESAMSMRKWAR